MTFTASNGAQVTATDCGTFKMLRSETVDNSVELAGVHTDALREFFQHERDEGLGRWRWPENPDYVVYKDGTSRRVIRESSGSFMQVSLHDREVMTTYLDSYVGAARAYDEAHPERKPWEDAKAGEAWVIGFPAGPVVAYRRFDGHFYDYEGNRLFLDRADSARRIWPEP